MAKDVFIRITANGASTFAPKNSKKELTLAVSTFVSASIKILKIYKKNFIESN